MHDTASHLCKYHLEIKVSPYPLKMAINALTNKTILLVSILVQQNFTLALPSHTSLPSHWLPVLNNQLSCIFIGPQVPL